MITAAHTQPMAQAIALPHEESPDLSRQEIAYLMLMWGLLALNVMAMVFINASQTHCILS